MKDPIKPEEKPQPNENPGAEWFAAWLPKPNSVVPCLPAEPLRPSEVNEIRIEIQAVAGHLIDPGATGVRACLPHLERAISLFGSHVNCANVNRANVNRANVPALPVPEPALDDLRRELALASGLFENAYMLQEGWAAQLGINLDGTPRQLLYSRPGAPQNEPATGSWEA